MDDAQTTRDTAFAPLLTYLKRHVRDEKTRKSVLGNYMYMYESDSIFAYKHGATRQYILIRKDGALEEGKVDLRSWEF